MKKKIFLLAITIVGAIAGSSQGAGTGNMALENTLLRQRLDQLDKEIQDLRQSAIQREDVSGTLEHKPVWSSLDIQFYGYLKLDAAYDTSRIETGNYAKWVTRENQNDDDDQFNMTANETRLGFLINGSEKDGMTTSGKVEVDFYGAGAAENKAHLMMRHAYMKLDWKQERFNILAGQTSDVISPLVPGTLNYSVGWWSGNIGYRRPQIRLTREYSLKDEVNLKLEGALARTIGRDSVTSTDSGEDSGTPTWQGRASVTLPLINQKKATIGLSAHIGKEEYDLAASGRNTEFDTWSVNLDFMQPVNEKVSISAELFKGENLDAYLGGIGQGVNTDTTEAIYYEEINSSGGWIAACFTPWNNKKFNIGIAMDDVERGEVNDGDRILNRSLFGNIIYSLNKQADFGFELSHWRTEYYGSGDAESLRAQAALIYRF
ncbi:MAG: hypothetical protein JW787_14480 [Sedimentisphaerales bacterium]|nr:hypothetical protein [Sedimentisphaerales bacterium]